MPKAVGLCSRGIVAICSKWSAETVVPTSAKLRREHDSLGLEQLQAGR